MAKLFGFSIEETQNKSANIVSPVPKNNEDGVDNYIASGFYGQYVDIEGAYRSEHELIKRYREMALHPEADGAIEDVVNEAIVSDLYDSPVEVELSNLNASEGIKKKIREEFRYIKELMDFDKKSHEIFRNWYIDGRLYYLKVIDQKNPQEGLKDLRYIDPMKIKYVRQEKKSTDRNLGNLRIPGNKGDEAVPKVIEFEHELEEGKDYKLIIDRSNKRVNDTIVNEKGDITHDQLLHIKSIMIDEIDIGGLVYEGVYKPIYPEQWSKQQKEKGVEFPETLKNVTQMGHNGTWTFNFSSPFYMWLLENLY